MRAGTSIPALWETGISQTVSEIRRISFGTDTVRLPPSALRQLYRGVLRDWLPPKKLLPDPVSGELVRDAAAPVPFPLGPEDRLLLRFLRPRETRAVFPAQHLHPPPDHLDVQVLRERVEGHPDPEPPREGDLLLHGLPVVDLSTRHHRAAVIALVLGRSEEHTSELQSRPHLVCRL